MNNKNRPPKTVVEELKKIRIDVDTLDDTIEDLKDEVKGFSTDLLISTIVKIVVILGLVLVMFYSFEDSLVKEIRKPSVLQEMKEIDLKMQQVTNNYLKVEDFAECRECGKIMFKKPEYVIKYERQEDIHSVIDDEVVYTHKDVPVYKCIKCINKYADSITIVKPRPSSFVELGLGESRDITTLNSDVVVNDYIPKIEGNTLIFREGDDIVVKAPKDWKGEVRIEKDDV